MMYRAYGNGYGSRHVFIRRRRLKWGWVLLILLLVALLALAGYTAFDNGHVRVREQRVFCADLPEKLEGFTVLQLSDLGGMRFGREHQELMRALRNKQWDAVICTGNMLGETGDPHPFYELISAVGTDKPFYFLAGCADPAAIGQEEGFYTVVSDWVDGALSRGAIYLDRPQRIEYGGETVWLTEPAMLTMDLAGAQNAYAASDTAESRYWLGVVSDTIAARKEMAANCGLHLLVSAEPYDDASVRKLLESADGDFVRTVDLIVAGGAAGGQWRLPGVGGVWALDRFFPKMQLSGYGYAASLLQVVSAGLGVNPQSPLPKFRFLNPPEATLLTFTSQIDLDTLP